MPVLEWEGKEASKQSLTKIPFPEFRKEYYFGEDGFSDNMVIRSDNLYALKYLMSRYQGGIKCIYADPPYNRRGDHNKWLCMIYPRLCCLKSLLTDDGIIFFSIDDYENYHLRCVCNEVFGGENYIETAVRRRIFVDRHSGAYAAGNHDYIIAYAKDKRHIMQLKGLTEEDLYKTNYTRRMPFKSLLLDSDTEFEPGTYDSIFPVADGIWPFKGCEKDVDPDKEIQHIFHSDMSFRPTPKPVRLMEKILKTVSDRNAIVLDIFAGTGTTGHAVLNLNKKDGGNRRFILVEMMDYAETITAERIKRVIRGYDYEDVHVSGTGGGFGYYVLQDGSKRRSQ